MQHYRTNLEKWMADNEVTSYRLGKLCNVSQSVAYRWMTGDCRPSFENCAVIAKVTGNIVTANDFVPDVVDAD